MNSYLFIKPDLIKVNMFGDDQMVKTFIGMYLTHCFADFANLSQAVVQKDLTEIASKAHHMKPTMAYIGATQLHEQFQELESLARRGADVDKALDLYHRLENDFHAMMHELNYFYSTLA